VMWHWGHTPHQELPFEKLVAELQPQRDLSRQPLFQVIFTWQNTPHEQLGLPGLQVSGWPCPRRSAAFDLSWHAFETPDELQGMVEYATELFDAATIERLVESFQCLLTAVGRDAQKRISQLL